MKQDFFNFDMNFNFIIINAENVAVGSYKKKKKNIYVIQNGIS